MEGPYLDEGLHEVLLCEGVAAAHDLLSDPWQHHRAVQIEVQAVQLAEVSQVLAHQIRQLLPIAVAGPLIRPPRFRLHTYISAAVHTIGIRLNN